MKLYFVRHGESTANVLWEFCNTDHKHPLTDKGVEQAHALSSTLSGLAFDRIYSSPILRALQTAHILAEALHAPVEVAEALREWSVGIYEGTRDPAGWEAHAWVRDRWFNHQDLDARMLGGESYREIKDRFFPFIEGLILEGQDTERNLLLVGHGGLYAAMLPILFTNVGVAFAQEHGFANTAYALAELRPGGLYCVSWCGLAMEPRSA